MNITTTITTESKLELPVSITTAAITAIALPMLKERGLTGEWQLDCSFVGNETMQALNKEAQGYDEPTDVLSFPIHFATNEADPHVVLPVAGPQLLGSIVISLTVADRQATERNTPLEVELLTLIEHGLHHLLGEDHSDAGEWLPRTSRANFNPRHDSVHGELDRPLL